MTTPQTAPPTSRRALAILIRVSEAEKRELDQAARSERLPTGTWLRRLGQREADRLRKAYRPPSR